MNEKMVKNLGIALIVLLGLLGLMRWQQNNSYEPTKPKGFDFAAITAKNTERIDVKGGAKNYTLIKFADKWQLDGLEIDQSAIETIFTGLKDAQIQQVAATKEDKLAILEVDGSSGKTVTFKTSKRSFTYVFGKASPDGTGFYIRAPKAKEAYLASGTVGTTFSKKAEDWYSKQVLALTQGDIEKVEFAENELVLSKNKKQWFMNQEGQKSKADTNKVESFLSTIGQLYATSVDVDKNKVKFDSSKTITLMGKKSKILATIFYQSKSKKELYIKNKDKKSFLFAIDESGKNNLLKKPKDFK